MPTTIRRDAGKRQRQALERRIEPAPTTIYDPATPNIDLFNMGMVYQIHIEADGAVEVVEYIRHTSSKTARGTVGVLFTRDQIAGPGFMAGLPGFPGAKVPQTIDGTLVDPIDHLHINPGKTHQRAVGTRINGIGINGIGINGASIVDFITLIQTN